MGFIFMLSLQLAGALLLLINSCRFNKAAVIKNCFPGSNNVERDDKNNGIIPKEKLQKSAVVIYYNIASFADLVIGYGIAVFSPTAEYSTLITFLGVIVFTAIIIGAEFFSCPKIAKKIFSKDELVPYGELEENEVETCATSEEILELFGWNNK